MTPLTPLLTVLAVVFLLGPLHPAAKAAERFKAVDALVERSVANGVFPGASIAILYKNKLVYHKPFGRLTYYPGSPRINLETIYDTASLTKPIVTTSIIMQLTERDSLDLDDRVSLYIPEFGRNGKKNITIENLMLHNSGLIPHRFFIENCRTPWEVFQAIDNEALSYPTGTQTRYSDLGFITLARIIERITGRTLEDNFQARFSEPLGMHNTMFNPPDSLLPDIAPTEEDSRWTLSRKRPLVHDHNAALLGGTAGHAGLFSTTGDLIRFIQMIMHEGKQSGTRYFKSSTIRHFTRRKGDGKRALGWDLRTIDGPSSAGQYFSDDSFGHLGYTGTSIWIDPKRDLAVITLTNRVHPTSENIKIRKFRPKLHDTVIECLGLE